MFTDNFSVTSPASPGQRKKYRRRRGPPALASLEAYGTTAHHGMTSPEHALHRGRTPSLESMDDDMSHITFETAPFYVPDSTLSHAELKSWHTSLHNESGGARSLAIYGELRLREALMLDGDAKPHAVMAAVSGDLLLKLTTLYRRFGNFTRLLTETQLRCVFADYDHIIAPELGRGVTRATLGRATPWFDVASQLKARLVACKATASRNREVVERWRRKYDQVAKNRALRAWRLHVRHAKVVRRLRLKLYLRAWLLVAIKNARRRQACAAVLQDALKGAVGQDRVELAWATVEQEPMRTGKENFTLGYETGVDAVATDAAMAEMVEEDFGVSFGDIVSEKIEELPSPKEEEGGFLDTLASKFDDDGDVKAVNDDMVDIVRGWGPPPPRLDDETDEAYQERLRKGGYACWLPAAGESMDQWRHRIAKATPLHGETDAQWLLRMVPDVIDNSTQTLLRGHDSDDSDEDDGHGRRRKRHPHDAHEKRRRKHQKQARARRQREHHELGLAHHHSKRHGTHSVRGMPIQQALQLIPALLEEALRADVTAAVHEARARGDALVASLVAAAAAAKPFRTLAMTACVRRFGMRNLAVKKLRAVVATCKDDKARARHMRLELFAVLLGLAPGDGRSHAPERDPEALEAADLKCLNLVVRRYVGLVHAQSNATDAARQAPAELRKALLGAFSRVCRNRFDLPLLIDAARDAILTHLDAELLTQAVAALEALGTVERGGDPASDGESARCECDAALLACVAWGRRDRALAGEARARRDAACLLQTHWRRKLIRRKRRTENRRRWTAIFAQRDAAATHGAVDLGAFRELLAAAHSTAENVDELFDEFSVVADSIARDTHDERVTRQKELWAALAVQAAVFGSSWFAKRTGTSHEKRLARARGAQALDYWFGQLVNADADILGEELDDAQEAKLHLMLEGARGEDVHLEAFLRVVEDHNLEVGAKAREEPKTPMQARLRKKRRSRGRPKSATRGPASRPKSATRGP